MYHLKMSEETNASSATESSVKEPAVTAADTQKKVVKKPSIGKYRTTLQKSLNSVLTKYVCVSCNRPCLLSTATEESCQKTLHM